MKRVFNCWMIVAAVAFVYSCVGVNVNAAAFDLTDGLQLYLPMDGNVADTSGMGAITSTNGAPTFGAGKVGQAVTFVNPSPLIGTPEYVNAGSGTNLNFGTDTDFSVQFWLNTTSTFNNDGTNHDDPGFVSNKDWDSGGSQGYVIAAGGGGRLQWNLGDGAGGARMDYDGPAGALNDGNWHHVVWTLDRDTAVNTYLDGVSVDSQGATNLLNLDTPAGLQTRIGTDGTAGVPWAQYFDGTLDEIAIWNRALTVNEVGQLYNNGAGTAISAVPEPTSLGLLGMIGLGLVARRKRK